MKLYILVKLSNNNDYNFIVNISEDGWFGNSIGPYQHFATVFLDLLNMENIL